MRIAEASGYEKITWDGRQNFPQREVFFPQSPEVSHTAKKCLHLVMIQLLCYPIHAKRSPNGVWSDSRLDAAAPLSVLAGRPPE